MRYLGTGSEGPGFPSPEEAGHVLEKIVVPSFEALIELEKGKKILGGGLPLGDRSLVYSSYPKATQQFLKFSWASGVRFSDI